ncbi:hypothetical protein, partial [Salmonella enterica]
MRMEAVSHQEKQPRGLKIKILQIFMVRLLLDWPKQFSFINELKLRMKSRMESSMPNWTVVIEVQVAVLSTSRVITVKPLPTIDGKRLLCPSTCRYKVICCGTVAKLAMRQPFVLFKGLTFQKLCLPGA